MPQLPNASVPSKALTSSMDLASLAYHPATLTKLELNVSNVNCKPSTIRLQVHANLVLVVVYSIVKL